MDQPKNPDSRLPMERVLYEVKKIIVGQDHLLERMVVAPLARGHILVEGVPGLAKTMAIKTLAESIGGEFKRIQFTPDLSPPISSARGFTTRKQASLIPRSARCLPTYYWLTKSTVRPPKCKALCWKSCRSDR